MITNNCFEVSIECKNTLGSAEVFKIYSSALVAGVIAGIAGYLCYKIVKKVEEIFK